MVVLMEGSRQVEGSFIKVFCFLNSHEGGKMRDYFAAYQILLMISNDLQYCAVLATVMGP